MRKKTRTVRKTWTKDEIKLLKVMAKQKKGRDKIAKSLKRTPAAVMVKASMLSISLSTR